MQTTDKTINTLGSVANTQVEFTTEELNKALFEVEGLCERAMVKFILLGQAAKDVKEQRGISGDKLVIAIRKNDVNPYVLSVIRQYVNVVPSDKGFEYKAHNIPVKVKFVGTKFPFFDHPDTSAPYFGESYQLPNPFNEYWKVRNLIC